MLASGQGYIPGYINCDDLVEGALEGVAQHRQQTRQRHLSGSSDDIASSYFASQFGGQTQQKQQQLSKQNSRTNSRRNSFSSKTQCSNTHIQSTMANAAAKIAQLKKQDRDEHNARFKEQSQQSFQSSQNSQQSIQIIQQSGQSGQQSSQNGQQSSQMMQQSNQMVNQSMQVTEQSNNTMQQTCQVVQQTSQTLEQSNVTLQHNFQQSEHSIQQNYQTIQQNGQAMEQNYQNIQQNGQSVQQSYQNGHAIQQNYQNGQATEENFQYVKQNGQAINQNYQNGHAIHQNYQNVQQNGQVMQMNGHQQQVKAEQGGSRAGSRRGSTQFSYISLLPEDGSYPHRTQPIGDPVTKKTGSAAPTPDREVGRKWSISSSTDYLNKTGKGNYAVRSNPIGLAEPSLGKDGYAVGKDGSMYRSTGNLNVAGGRNSRAGSEVKDVPSGNWKERRASAADVKGSGIRTGGNLIEPSSKPPASFYMPFGSSGHSFVKRKASSTVQEKKTTKRERNKTISGDSSCTMNSLNQALSSLTTKQEEVVNVTVGKPRARAHSMPRSQVTSEETSYTVSLPGSRRTSRHPSVEPEGRKKLSRHGSVEIFDAGYNLTVPNKMSRHSSQAKLEEVHADHFYFPGSKEEGNTTTLPANPQPEPSVQCIAVSVHKNADSKTEVEAVQPVQQSQVAAELSTLTSQISQFTSQTQESTIQQSSHTSRMESTSQTMVQSTSSTTQQSMQSTSTSSTTTQQKMQSSTSASSTRSRHSSGLNGTVTQGQRFNITEGLKRSSRLQSQEDVSKSSKQQVNDLTAGSALKVLDSALQEFAVKQQQAEAEQVQYVAKVSSRQSSRRCSTAVQDGGDVTNVTVSLPPSRTGSRAASRRNSVDLGKGSRRNSLDIYTAEYAVKIGQTKKIDSMEQKSAFHIKVDNEAESGLNLCGRCHLPTHSTSDCTEFNDSSCPRCLSWDHWENSCPVSDSEYACTRCNYIGHVEEVHDVTKFSQRRTCVDLLGWEPFQPWFYETDFRNWWQVSGCVGVPLYRIYPRKTVWRQERRPEDQVNQAANQVSRTDSVDDMIAQVMSQRREYKPPASDSSGRSTPVLPKEDQPLKQPRKVRTFSETLRSLDEDILAELDVK